MNYRYFIILSVFLVLSVACQCDDSSIGELRSKLVISINGKEVSNYFDFGDITVSKEIAADVQLKNMGETEISISAISIQGGNGVFRVDSIEDIKGYSEGRLVVPTSASADFKIYYRPTKASPPADEGFMIISSNLQERPEISIRLTGEGLKANIQIEPIDMIDFGRVDIYSKSTKEIIVKNTGTDVFTITNAIYKATGASTDIYLNSPPKLPLDLKASEDIMFSLIYLPTDIGEDKGVLIFESSLKDLPVVEIPVKGEGVSPLIKIEPPLIDFGGVEVNQSSTKDFTVYNNGNKDLIIYRLDFSELSSKYLTVSDPSIQKTIAPQGSTKYSVTFAPKTKEGAIESRLQIHCNDPQLIDKDADNYYIAYLDIKSRTPFPKIDVSGAVTIQLGCNSPYNAQDPNCASGCTMDCCCFDYNGFVIRNVGDALLSVTRVELTDNGSGMIEIEPERQTPYTLNTNESTNVTIRYRPTSFGQHLGKIVIESNDPKDGLLEISIVATSFQR